MVHWSIGPKDAPAATFPTSIRLEVDIDNIGPAYDGGRQGIAALLVHQDCSVTVRDSQVVKTTEGRRFQIEGDELQCQDLPLRCSKCFCLLIV